MAQPALRFGVGSPDGARSSVWRVWPGAATSDVYIACRPIAAHLKVSLHESGEWLDQYHPDEIPSDLSSRRRAAWTRPDDRGDGWVMAYRIMVPASELRVPDGHIPSPRGTYWHPAPALDRTVEFTVAIATVFASLDRPPGRHVNASQVGRFILRNGETVLLLAHESTATTESTTNLEALRSLAVEDISWRLPSWSNRRAIYSGVDDNGMGRAVELAVPDRLSAGSPASRL